MAVKDKLCKHKGKTLVPVRIDMHTWVLLPKKKATKKGIEEYKQHMAESRELAMRHYYGSNIQYDKM